MDENAPPPPPTGSPALVYTPRRTQLTTPSLRRLQRKHFDAQGSPGTPTAKAKRSPAPAAARRQPTTPSAPLSLRKSATRPLGRPRRVPTPLSSRSEKSRRRRAAEDDRVLAAATWQCDDSDDGGSLGLDDEDEDEDADADFSGPDGSAGAAAAALSLSLDSAATSLAAAAAALAQSPTPTARPPAPPHDACDALDSPQMGDAVSELSWTAASPAATAAVSSVSSVPSPAPPPPPATPPLSPAAVAWRDRRPPTPPTPTVDQRGGSSSSSLASAATPTPTPTPAAALAPAAPTPDLFDSPPPRTPTQEAETEADSDSDSDSPSATSAASAASVTSASCASAASASPSTASCVKAVAGAAPSSAEAAGHRAAAARRAAARSLAPVIDVVGGTGEAHATRLRLRNTSATSAARVRLAVAGGKPIVFDTRPRRVDLAPGARGTFELVFAPKDAGEYAATLVVETRCVGDASDASSVVRMRLRGMATCSPVKKPRPRRGGAVEASVWDEAPPASPSPVKEAARFPPPPPPKSPAAAAAAAAPPSTPSPTKQARGRAVPASLSGGKSLDMPALFFRDAAVDFGAAAAGDLAHRKVRLCNGASRAVEVAVALPGSPFEVSHTTVRIRARSYVNLPVLFAPVGAGRFEAVLVCEAGGAGGGVARLWLQGVGTAAPQEFEFEGSSAVL